MESFSSMTMIKSVLLVLLTLQCSWCVRWSQRLCAFRYVQELWNGLERAGRTSCSQ